MLNNTLKQIRFYTFFCTNSYINSCMNFDITLPYTSVAGVHVVAILDTVLHGQLQHTNQCCMGICNIYSMQCCNRSSWSQFMASGRRLTYPQTCTRSFRSTRQAHHTTNSPPHCRRWNESQRHTCTRHVIPARKSCLRVSGLCVEWSVD